MDGIRSARYKYRYTIKQVAEELGIPSQWLWSWVLAGDLRIKHWLGQYWVRKEDAQACLGNLLSTAPKRPYYY